MNVLLISFSFPPAGGVGVLRALSLAKYLPAEGVRVDVLTARNAPAVGQDPGLLAQVPADVTVHRTWTLDLPFALRKWVKKRLGGAKAIRPAPADTKPSSPSRPEAQPQPRATTGRRNPIRGLVANLLLPDPQIGWLPFALPAARRIIRRRKIDAVLITVPPFSSAALVRRLRRSFPSLPIVLDFRDEWLSTTLDLVSYNNNPRAREIARRTESEAIRSATKIVLVTEAARREVMARYPAEPASKFLCIENGFDREPIDPAERAPTKNALEEPTSRAPSTPDDLLPERHPVLFTYLGTVYGSTDPATLVAAVQQLPPELRERVWLRFIGHIERQRDRDALEGLRETVELRAFVPQAEALRAIEATDWLLLITHDRINVAAKFYDYLAGGKPIFAAVHPDGDVRRLLEETGAGVWADVRDPEAIRTLFEAVLDSPEHPGLPERRPEHIARFHRRALTRRYAQVLQNIAGVSVPPERNMTPVPEVRQHLAKAEAPSARAQPTPEQPAETRR